jgi:hypothetical protein
MFCGVFDFMLFVHNVITCIRIHWAVSVIGRLGTDIIYAFGRLAVDSVDKY